jgi:hypothetical protein
MLAMLLLALLAASLSGCASNDPAALPADEPSEGFQNDLFAGEADAGTPAGDAGSHGTPQREDGPVETGSEAPLQFPGSYARRTITISNDFGGASLGTLFAGVESGTITVVPGEGEDSTIVAVLEARGATEQEARDALDRVELTHDDLLEADGLHLTTLVRERPAQQVLPGVTINVGTWAQVDLTITLPAGPAYDLTADASSGDIDVSGLRGPMMQFTTSSGSLSARDLNVGMLTVETSSGDIDLATVQADILEASLSSGDLTGEELRVGKAVADLSSGSITLEGVFDTLEADAGSGTIDVEAHALASGAYTLSASSGDINLQLLTGPMRAYHVTADTSSGTVQVDLEDSDTIDEEDDFAEVVSDGFDDAAIKTVVEIETGSGNIEVSDRSLGSPDRDEDAAAGGHNHGG